MSKETRRCAATTASGTPCKARSLPGSEFCFVHARTPEDRAEQARQAAERSAEVRRANAKAPASARLASKVTRDDVMRVVAEALTSEDTKRRLLACAVLLSTFPDEFKTTPHEARKALEAALPEQARDDLRDSVAAVYRAGREEWAYLRRRYSPLSGLYVEPFPPGLIAPWEDREAVLREELPAPIPPEAAEKMLRRTADGRLLLQDDGGAQLIPEDAAVERATMRHRLRARIGA
jgi:hypothetical protein